MLESPLIDIFDNHYYHGKHTDLPGIKRDAAFVVGKHKKAFVLGEFGFDYNTCEPIYAEAYRNKLISGAMIWSLRYHCRDGTVSSISIFSNFLSRRLLHSSRTRTRKGVLELSCPWLSLY